MTKTKWVSMLCALMLLLCSGIGAVAENTLALTEDPVTLTIFAQNHSAGVVKDYSELKGIAEANRLLNVEVEWTMPTIGSEQDQFNLMIASGNYPDIIVWVMKNTPMKMTGLLEEGIIIDADPYIREYATNYMAMVQADPDMNKQTLSVDNTYVGMYKLEPVAVRNGFRGIIFRKDVLDEIGSTAPVTIGDWYALLNAVKEQKPDMAPFTAVKSSRFGEFMPAYGINDGFGRSIETGNVEYGYAQPAYLDFLTEMNKWYSEGLIDADYLTQDGKIMNAKMIDGTAFAAVGNVGGAIGNYTASARPGNPDYLLNAARYPANLQDGVSYTSHFEMMVKAGSDVSVITSACKNPKIAVQYMDFFYSDQGNNLINWGIEGESYEIVDGEKRFTDQIMNNPEGLTPIQAIYKYCNTLNGIFKAMDFEAYCQLNLSLPEQREAMEIWGNADTSLIMPPLELALDINAEYNNIMTDITTYVDEMNLKFITGVAPLSEFDKYIETLQKMNLGRATEIMQAAYDAYTSR